MAERRPVVLVVEDEASIRMITERMLKLGGYDAVCCASAEEALGFLASGEDDVDLLLSDIHLDDMTGTELAEEVRRIRPSMGVILMSGDSEAEAVGAGVAPGTQFLGKPFTRATLVAAIDAGLRPRPGSS